MEKSQTIAELAKALIKFQKLTKAVAYDANNPYFKSKYATLSALVSETREDLANCGLTVSQLVGDDGSVTTILMHESGEFLMDKVNLKPVKDDPQGRGSAITYSRRYAYAAILGLVTDEDDDGNKASHSNGKEEPLKMPVASATRPIAEAKPAETVKATVEPKNNVEKAVEEFNGTVIGSIYINEWEKDEIKTLAKQKGLTPLTLKELLIAKFNTSDMKLIPSSLFKRVIEALNELK